MLENKEKKQIQVLVLLSTNSACMNPTQIMQPNAKQMYIIWLDVYMRTSGSDSSTLHPPPRISTKCCAGV